MEADALMLVALLGAHFFFDYAGQGDFMAKAKNCSSPMPGVPAAVVLWSHGAIHGAAAALITGLWPVFLAETCLHSVFDDAKCRGSSRTNWIKRCTSDASSRGSELPFSLRNNQS
jgi:hypothetical protein